MKGIIIKDYMIARFPKNLISSLLNIGVAFIIAVFMRGFYGMGLAVMLLSLSGSTLLQISMEQDELSDFDKLQLTFPLTKKQIVLAKYLGGAMLQGSYFIASLIIVLIYRWAGIVSLTAALQVWLLGVILGIIFFAISYTGFYLLGNKRGSIMYAIAAASTAAMYVLMYLNIDVFDFLLNNANLVLIVGLVIAVLILSASYFLSLKIYTKRYS